MNLTRTITSIAILSAGLCGTVTADFVGLNIGASHWSPDLAGSFNSTDNGSVKLDNDLTSTSISISFEHPIPLIPNVKYQGADLNASNTSTTTGLTFNDITYNAGEINSTLDLSHNDIVLYYEILDNWINIDIGLDLRTFDGKVSIKGDEGIGSISVDETILTGYLAARVDLPFTGFYVGANIQQLSIGDNSAEDTTLMVGYESSAGLGIEGGIKSFNLELNDASNLDTNLEYDGLYLNGYFHF